MLVEVTPKMRHAGESFYQPFYVGTMRLLERQSDEELEAMIEFLERGRMMVEQELRRLEAGGEAAAPPPADSY